MTSSHLHAVVDLDGAAILDIERGLISALNPTAAFVWLGLERGETVDTIATNLARETGEDAITVERDVREFIESLKKQRLLQH